MYVKQNILFFLFYLKLRNSRVGRGKALLKKRLCRIVGIKTLRAYVRGSSLSRILEFIDNRFQLEIASNKSDLKV